MHHTTKSILVVSFVIVMMFAIGLMLNLNQSITGAVISGSPACYVDSDCDDKIENTEDICRNPGTQDSFCINRPKDDFE